MVAGLIDVERFPMLRVCDIAGCAKVVFGGGTCVDHDSVAAVSVDDPAEARTDAARGPAVSEHAVSELAGVVAC